jgi:hypothetical protein
MRRSTALGGLMAVVAGVSVATCGAAPGGAEVPPTVIGMNLGQLNAYQSIWPFADLIASNGRFFFPRPGGWIYPKDTENGPVDPAGEVRFDAKGNPVDVPAGTRIGLTLQLASSPRNPAGTLSCHVSPGWDVRVVGGSKTPRGPDSFDVQFDGAEPSGAGAYLLLTPSGAKASLTEASCLLPGTKPGDLVNPAYVEELKPFRILRFMDWMRTNNAAPARWADRTTADQVSQLDARGVSLEYMIALANAAKSDPWFTVPFDADDDYYRHFAEFVRDHLDPGRKVYVELSNEVWNGQFQQAKAAIKRGTEQGLDANPRVASDRFYAERVVALMAIWSKVFAGQEKRLVRVVSAQAVSPASSERILSWKDTAKSVDALAVAPYFGMREMDPAMSQEDLTAAIFGAQGIARIDAAIDGAAKQKEVAAKYGLRLIAYEGGQHFADMRSALGPKYAIINADQRMELLYRRYLDGWRTRIGDALVLYNDVNRPSKGGSWGHREYTGQPLAEAPKMRAVLAEIAKGEK